MGIERVHAIFALLFSATVACGGTLTSTPGGPEPEKEGGTGEGGPIGPITDEAGPPSCGAIAIIPPLITVRFSDDGNACDPTFQVVDAPDGSVGGPSENDAGDAYAARCPSNNAGCPPKGQAAACEFVVFVDDSVGDSTDFTVQVSEPGYFPAVVHGVHDGISGCVSSPTPASSSTVTLVRAPDDAGVRPLEAGVDAER